ncbi:thiolase family protein [Canibacter sp. lx-72]|uniref:thiolase family protein n=1 Tax=Canibacter zhuwentaonis TaxID=2837491 RepID=UPI001BDCAD7F|nr:thiolase family protein [Canibacter zhuwentaonis]MBT1034988.1 thiolase family protein [Canibacter zhuwentaonis]
MTKKQVSFIDGVRTPFGRAGHKGSYWQTRADDLAVKALQGLLARNPELPLAEIDDVGIAATTQEQDQGLTLGRTVGMLAGLPETVPGFALDRMCAGAMTTTSLLASVIAAGHADLTIAGGVEHMGKHPMRFASHANPRFFAENKLSEAALNMGNTAEKLHDRFPHLTKERADQYALNSQLKAEAAYQNGYIQADLVPVAVTDEGGWRLVSEDEGRRPSTTLEGLSGLKTPFRVNGKVTAGNSSPLTDGATVALLASSEKAAELGFASKMNLVTYAFAGVDPEVMGLGPVPAAEKALRRAGLDISDIGLFELNEAFAVQVLSFTDHFDIADDDPRVNPWGGAIALGHPLAASGVRLLIQLAKQFEQRPDVRYGMAAMCVGLGQGGAMIWENPHYNGKKG